MTFLVWDQMTKNSLFKEEGVGRGKDEEGEGQGSER